MSPIKISVDGNSRKKKSGHFTVSTQVLLLAKKNEAHYLMFTVKPNIISNEKEIKNKKNNKIVN
jgi:hypothetical protein